MSTPIEHLELQETSLFHDLQAEIGRFLAEALPEQLSEAVMTEIKGDPLKALDARLKKTGLIILVQVTDVAPDGDNDELLTITLMFHCEELFIVNHGAGGTKRAVLDVACLVWAAMKKFPDDKAWGAFRFEGIEYSGQGAGDAAYDLQMTTTTRITIADEMSGQLDNDQP